jgi:DUF4097 and DUF4098 domain-containing protein YvlB
MGLWILFVSLAIAAAQQLPTAPKPAEPTLPPYVEQSLKQFSFYPGGKVVIAASVPGNIKVIGWQRSSIRVEIEKIVFNLPADKAKELSAAFPAQVRWTQTTATVRASGPAQAAASMEVNLTIYVPKTRTDVNIKMLQGDLGIGQINGWIEATLNEGSIEAKSLSGYFSAKTQRGDISAELAGKRWEGHSFTAVTEQGSVELRLPLQYSAGLQLETREGTLTIDYPTQEIEGQEEPLTALAKKGGHSMKAAVGEGGSPIRLMTNAGNISLLAKQLP